MTPDRDGANMRPVTNSLDSEPGVSPLEALRSKDDGTFWEGFEWRGNEGDEANVYLGESFGTDWNFVSKESTDVVLPDGSVATNGDWLVRCTEPPGPWTAVDKYRVWHDFALGGVVS